MKNLISFVIGIAMALGIAYAQTIQPSSSGGAGGITSLTANSTGTTGFAAGQILFSDGSKLQASTATTDAIGELSAMSGAISLKSSGGTPQIVTTNANIQLSPGGLDALQLASDGTLWMRINSTGSRFILGSNADLSIAENAAGVMEVNNGSVGTFREIIARSYIGGGTSPSNSGSCAVTSQLGGNTVGQFVASGACAAGTYIFTFGFSAPNGWACDAEDRTTITDTIQQTASTVTGATFKATTASADVVSWKCSAY